MDFAIPQELEHYYAELEAFIENTIDPMVARDDNIRFFDHRREDARTDATKHTLARGINTSTGKCNEPHV